MAENLMKACQYSSMHIHIRSTYTPHGPELYPLSLPSLWLNPILRLTQRSSAWKPA